MEYFRKNWIVTSGKLMVFEDKGLYAELLIEIEKYEL